MADQTEWRLPTYFIHDREIMADEIVAKQDGASKVSASVVTDIRLESQVGFSAVWWMSLDASPFEFGDAGMLEAETRSGTKLEIPVNGLVSDGDGVLWHVVEKPLAAGTKVLARVTHRN